MKVRASTYFAPISIMAGGVWGSDKSPDGALKRACREAVSFADALGGFKEDARITVNVFSIRDGCYAYQDERGIFEVDKETDEIVARAMVAYRYEDVDPRKPLTTCRLGKAEDAYVDGGEAARRANAEGKAPIGEKVAA